MMLFHAFSLFFFFFVHVGAYFASALMQGAVFDLKQVKLLSVGR